MWGTPITAAGHRRVAFRLGNRSEAPSEAWRRQAACRGLDASLFHPVDDEGSEDASAAELARVVCGRCSVREACLEYALTAPERHGIWGGLTARERRRILRRRRESA